MSKNGFRGIVASTSVSLIMLIFGNVASASSIQFKYARVSNNYPCQNSTLKYTAKIVNGSGLAVKNAHVTFKVYYKTTTTSYGAGYTDVYGKVSKSFSIGRATIGYKVIVRGKATKNGLVATKATWFIPKKCT